MGYSPCGCEELDMTKRLHFHFLSVVSNSFATPWTVAPQAPLSMGFSRQESWSEFPCPSSGAFPTQGWNTNLLYLLLCRQVLDQYTSI